MGNSAPGHGRRRPGAGERGSIGAGIAEGRGGYPGGSNAPGWSQYVNEQRSYLAIYRAACALSADRSGGRRDYFRSLEVAFAPVEAAGLA